jgi:hypothetical protein
MALFFVVLPNVKHIVWIDISLSSKKNVFDQIKDEQSMDDKNLIHYFKPNF